MTTIEKIEFEADLKRVLTPIQYQFVKYRFLLNYRVEDIIHLMGFKSTREYYFILSTLKRPDLRKLLDEYTHYFRGGDHEKD